METFFLSVLSNALVALLMAVGIVGLSFRLKRPGVLHLLWLVVLVKLFVPPVLAFGVLPVPESGKVTLEASAITRVPGDIEGAPDPLSTRAIVGVGSTLVGVWALGGLWRSLRNGSPHRRLLGNLKAAHSIASTQGGP
jgi:hypothetical protein